MSWCKPIHAPQSVDSVCYCLNCFVVVVVVVVWKSAHSGSPE